MHGYLPGLRLISEPSIVRKGLAYEMEFFFFQAEDGIRDDLVTGVQTCALLLAEAIGAPLLATGLDLSASRYESLRAYERGFVKEGVGAGGAAIGATLHRGWGSAEMVAAIDALAAETIA